jgi:copper(I)-binding protein
MRLNRSFSNLLIMLALTWFSLSANAHGYQIGNIKIIHPWAMPAAAPIHGGASGMGFLILRNIGHQPDKLLSVSTAIAKHVELHRYFKDTQPTMRQTEAIEIPTGAEVRLEPGGSHLMLMGLEKPLVEGDHFAIMLEFEHAGKITIDVFVQLKAKEATY